MSESAVSPKLNLYLQADEKNSASLSINRIWRAPSMAEFYWHYKDFGFATKQNLPIKPEQGWGYEIALNHRFDEKTSTKATLGYPASNHKKYQVEEIGGYVVHNLSAAYDFTEDTTLSLALYNIFDKDYCEIYGYPMEGRIFTATLTQRF